MHGGCFSFNFVTYIIVYSHKNGINFIVVVRRFQNVLTCIETFSCDIIIFYRKNQKMCIGFDNEKNIDLLKLFVLFLSVPTIGFVKL